MRGAPRGRELPGCRAGLAGWRAGTLAANSACACHLVAPQCEISPKKAAGVVHKLLLQAKANAVTNAGLMESHLRVGACAGRRSVPCCRPHARPAADLVAQAAAACVGAMLWRQPCAPALAAVHRPHLHHPALHPVCAQPRRGWARAST